MDYRRTSIRIVLAFGIVGMLVGGAVGVSVGLEENSGSSLSEPESSSLTAVFSEEPLTSHAESTEFAAISSAVQSSSNSTDDPPPHRDPATIESDTDLAALAEQLQGSLDGNLAEALANAEAGDYDQAREALGDEYDRELQQYLDVAQELDQQEQAELFSAVQSDQAEYTDALEDYETARQAYEAAREEGDTRQARIHARELIDASERVDAAGGSTVEDYDELENTTGQDYSERTASIDERRTNTATTSETVSREEFIETTLSVSTNRTTVAFTDAVTLSGEIEPAAGSVNRHEAQILFGEQSYRVEVNSNGQFEILVEPAGTWEAADEFTVEYQPESDTVFLDDETTVPLSVTNTETEFFITDLGTEASASSPISIDGTLRTTENQEAVPNTPIEIRVDGHQLTPTETTEDGTIDTTKAIPATVSAGKTDVELQLASSPRALSGDTWTEQIEIEPTEPVLTVDATSIEGPQGETQLSVEGTFETPNGRAIPDAELSVGTETEELGTVQTDETGAFAEQFELPADTASGGRLRVITTFEGENSHLDTTTEATTITLPETLLETVGLERTHAILIGLGSGIGFISVIVGAGWWLRETSSESTTSDNGDTGMPISDNLNTAKNQELLAVATDRLNSGAYRQATMIAYVAVRRAVSTDIDSPTTATHWEWYNACSEANIEQLDALQTLTESFEHVAFAPTDEATGSTEAKRAVELARQIIGAESS